VTSSEMESSRNWSEIELKIDLLRKAVTEEPLDWELHQELGRAYMKADKLVEAEDALNTARALNGKDPWTHMYFGNLCNRRGEHVAAIGHFKVAMQLMPDSATPLWCMAEMYECLDEYEKADNYYRKAVEIDPSDEHARSKWAQWQEWYKKPK